MIDMRFKDANIYITFMEEDISKINLSELLKEINANIRKVHACYIYKKMENISGEIACVIKELRNMSGTLDKALKKKSNKMFLNIYYGLKFVSINLDFIWCKCEKLDLTDMVDILTKNNSYIYGMSTVLFHECKFGDVGSIFTDCVYKIDSCKINTFLLLDKLINISIENSVIGILETPVPFAVTGRGNLLHYTNCHVDYGDLGEFEDSEGLTYHICKVSVQNSELVLALFGTDLYRRITLNDTKDNKISFRGDNNTLRVRDVGLLPKGYHSNEYLAELGGTLFRLFQDID